MKKTDKTIMSYKEVRKPGKKYYNYTNWSGNGKNIKHGYHYYFSLNIFPFCFYF